MGPERGRADRVSPRRSPSRGPRRDLEGVLGSGAPGPRRRDPGRRPGRSPVGVACWTGSRTCLRSGPGAGIPTPAPSPPRGPATCHSRSWALHRYRRGGSPPCRAALRTGRTPVVVGNPGTGKSRVARVLAARAAALGRHPDVHIVDDLHAATPSALDECEEALTAGRHVVVTTSPD